MDRIKDLTNITRQLEEALNNVDSTLMWENASSHAESNQVLHWVAVLGDKLTFSWNIMTALQQQVRLMCPFVCVCLCMCICCGCRIR
jgi:hypothetical protein